MYSCHLPAARSCTRSGWNQQLTASSAACSLRLMSGVLFDPRPVYYFNSLIFSVERGGEERERGEGREDYLRKSLICLKPSY